MYFIILVLCILVLW